MSQLEMKVHPIRHKTPCPECPFRRCAPEGWLGGATPDEFAMAVRIEMPISCHQTRGDGKKEAMCVGSLIYMRNQLMIPRTPELHAAMLQVKQDNKRRLLQCKACRHVQVAGPPDRQELCHQCSRPLEYRTPSDKE